MSGKDRNAFRKEILSAIELSVTGTSPLTRNIYRDDPASVVADATTLTVPEDVQDIWNAFAGEMNIVLGYSLTKFCESVGIALLDGVSDWARSQVHVPHKVKILGYAVWQVINNPKHQAVWDGDESDLTGVCFDLYERTQGYGIALADPETRNRRPRMFDAASFKKRAIRSSDPAAVESEVQGARAQHNPRDGTTDFKTCL